MFIVTNLTAQIQNFYSFVEQNLSEYDSAGFFYLKTPNQIAPGQFFDIYKLYSGDVYNDIQLEKTWVDNDLLITHYKYHQTFKGIKVEFGEATEHFTSNGLTYVNGKLVYEIESSEIPEYDSNAAKTTITSYLTPNISDGSKSPASIVFGTPELIFAIDNAVNLTSYIDGARYELAWEIPVMDTANNIDYRYFVNAANNTIFKIRSNIEEGTASIWYQGNQFIDTQWSGNIGRYKLVADDNGRNFHTREDAKVNPPKDYDDDWGTDHHDETAAHWGVMKSWDYFESTFGHSGFDNSGTFFEVLTSTSIDNAFFLEKNGYSRLHDQLKFGLTNNHYFNRAIDVIGHEYTHGINKYAGDLEYEFESGALSESFSDIFGFCVEVFSEGGISDWFVGEDPNLPYFRSMSQPDSYGFHLVPVGSGYSKATGQPMTYLGTNWFTGPVGVDKGGVHVNSGVPNHWFYLLVQGGTGVNDNNDSYSISGIGLTDASEIAFYNFLSNMQNGSQFVDARAGSIAYINQKWGVCSNQAIQNMNAWYAVGVGDPDNCNQTSVNNVDIGNVISVYPNPSNGIILVSLGLNEVTEINVISNNGMVLQRKGAQSSVSVVELDLTQYPQGIYIIEVKNKHSVTHRRIILTK